MMSRRIGTTVVAVLISSLIVTGCNGDNGDEDPTGQANPASPHSTVTEAPTPPTSAPELSAPEPSATTEPPVTEEPTASSREQDLLDIAEAAQAFEDVKAAIMAGEETVEYLADIAQDEAHSLWHNTLQGNRDAGWTQIGVPQVQVVDVEWITDDRVSIKVCGDVSDVDVVDESGNSVVELDRLDRSLREQEYRRADDQATYRWLITNDTGARTPCDD